MSSKTLTIPSDPAKIAELEDFLSGVLKDMHISMDKYPNILISLTEAVNNAILHGNKSHINKRVKIGCSGKDAQICFIVTDEGQGFDMNNVPDPTESTNIESCGGRGVFIMNSLADKVRFINNGSTVEMYFKCS